MNGDIPTVLFVDDEQPVLDGLYRRLWEQDGKWTMLFASSAAAALQMMAEQTVDVIVSDMRMPGMDGAALLHEVSRRYPTAVRFILSGFSDREAIFRTVGPAHQYFVKPCDPAILVVAVNRALAIRKRLQSPDLFALISGAKSIPAMPRALAELSQLLQSPNATVAQVAKIIASDVGLTTQLLKLINSAYFLMPTEISDVSQAIKLLGFELVRSLVMLGAVFHTFQGDGIDVAALTRLEERSLLIGKVAGRIAELEKMSPEGIQQCQCAGMLSHVGSLILFANRPVEMANLQSRLDKSGGRITAIEKHYLGASHPEVGACLLSLWGFGDTVVEAVLYHHRPNEADPNFIGQVDPIAIVHVAQHVVKPIPPGMPSEKFYSQGLDTEYLWRVGAIDRIDAWAEVAARALKEVSK